MSSRSSKRARSAKRMTVVTQAVIITGILALTLVIASAYAQHMVISMVTTVVIDDGASTLAARVARTDGESDGLPPSLRFAAVVDADGSVANSLGTPPDDLERLGPAPEAAVRTLGPLDHAVGLAGGRWLVAGLDPTWLGGEVAPMVAVIAMICIGAGVLCYVTTKAVSSAVNRRLYPLGPEAIAALSAEHEVLLRTMHDPALAVDDSGVLTVVNDSAIELLSLSPGDVGRAAEDVLPPALSRILRDGERADGFALVGDRALLVQANEAMAHTGGTSRLLVLRDHSELVRLLADLDGAEHTVDGLRAERHEFENTLHTISGLLDLGRGELAREYIRTGSGVGSFDVERHDVRDPVTLALLQAYRARAVEKGVRLEIDRDASLPPLSAPGRPHSTVSDAYATILGNLLSNALDSIEAPGSIRVELGWSTTAAGAEATIAVLDTGSGIDPAHIGRIFTRGFTTKGLSDDGHPRGIGLATASRLVKSLGGSIRAENRDTGGARFDVTLHIPPERMEADR